MNFVTTMVAGKIVIHITNDKIAAQLKSPNI